MAKLIYSAIASLDGYVADARGREDRVLEDAGDGLQRRTRIERDFDPEAVRRLKASAGYDLGVGGPSLAATALRAGSVDECHLFVTPIVVGGGTSRLPKDVHLELELVDERRFDRGLVHLH